MNLPIAELKLRTTRAVRQVVPGTVHLFASAAGALRVRNSAGATVSPVAASGTPIPGVAASRVLTIATQPATGSSVTIGGVTYTWRTALTTAATANEVLIGGSITNAAANLVLAINRGANNAGFGTDTVVNPLVSATSSVGAVTVTNKVKGVIGNSTLLGTPSTSPASGSTWASSATALGGGVDATAGVIGDLRFVTGFLYVATTTMTTDSDASGWKKVALGTL